MNETPFASPMILTPEALERLLDAINNPKPPTQALIDLMKSTPPWDETDQTISTGDLG